MSRSDIFFSSILQAKPRFPLLDGLRCAKNPDNFSPEIDTELYCGRDHMYATIKTVGKLSAIMENEETDEIARSYFSSNIYNLQHELVKDMAAASLNTLVNPESYTKTLQNHSVRISICIYINSILREIPIHPRMHLTMAERLKASIEQSGLEPLQLWEDQRALLLWILFVGASVVECGQERTYFVKHLVLVSMVMNLTSYEEFREVLERIAWVPKSCNGQAISIWEEIIWEASKLINC